ncbi:hypothetical protein [Hyphococcus sp.]|uniref:hypothetical protein n=1 Tax=Hyphococcus sp. TaxID=2038636 RepID=UPI0035C6FD9E
MEDNDLPDFDAEDLLAAMAEERRKDENVALKGDSSDPASQNHREELAAAEESGVGNVLDDVMEDRAAEPAR